MLSGTDSAGHATGQSCLFFARVAMQSRLGQADLLIVPELFLTGYAIGADAVHRLAETRNGAVLAEVAAIASDNRIAVVFGFAERDGDKVYNSAVAIGADGTTLGAYRKTHLFGDVDKQQFSEGRLPSDVFEINGLKVGLLICYDVEFPENTRSLALLGADLIIMPTALMQPYDVVARILVPARAHENQVYLAYCYRCGTEAPFTYTGLSCVIGPDGADLARAGSGEELIFADISLEALEQSRQHNTHLHDRRPEFYGALIKDMPARRNSPSTSRLVETRCHDSAGPRQ